MKPCTTHQHTPGDWIVSTGQIIALHIDEDGSHETLIADIFDEHDWYRANALLIAAAPEMLAALELCEDVLSELARTDDGTPSISALNMTRAALARAKAGAS